LSPLERVQEHFAFDDLSVKALQTYGSIAKLPQPFGSPGFKPHLVRLGLLVEPGNFRPTGFGLLLFGNEPRTGLRQAGLMGTIHYSDGKEEIRGFDGPQVLVPEQGLEWLRDKLPNVIDRSEARRRETSDAFFELVREGIVNALVHRDYSIEGAKCQLAVTPVTIEIRSPGRPIEPITMEQMQSFSAPMLSRNPVLHYVFAQMEMAEERGLGLKSMKKRAQDAGLPLPRYSWEDPYLVLTLYRTPSAATISLPESIQAALSEPERAGWQWLASQGHSKSADYAKAMKIDSRSARRHLNRFVELGLVEKTGSARATDYRVLGIS